ncbi:MAG: tubulin-like doman-containing protein [Acidobacteriota bacterium]
MSISTLVIGLGGTGVLTLRALKRLHNQLPEKERVPAAFLAFDFDRSAHMAGDHNKNLDSLNDDEFFYLNPQRIQERLRNIDRGEDGDLAWKNLLKWFPDRAKVPIPTSEVEANGASQLRVLGRLGFFDNDEVIERMIRLKLNQLGSEIDPSRLSEDKRVILVSSIAGGTGAGMMIDFAYVARRQLLRPRVYAYLLLPEVFQDVDSGGRIYQNAYACIKELAYLKDQQIPFEAEYERIPSLQIPVLGEEPLARVFLCTGEGFGGADSIKTATFQIAESILGQLQRNIQEKTLAIASNTLSADSHEEQKKRRTHCFSTVTSAVIPLRKVDLQEAIFDRVVASLREEKELEELYRDDLVELLGRIVREMSSKRPRRKPEPEEPKQAETEGEELPPEVRQIQELWQELGEEAAKQATDRIVAEIQSTLLLQEAEGFATASREELEERQRRLKELRNLLFVKLLEDEPNVKQVPFLQESPAYQSYVAALEKILNLELLKPETQLSTSSAVKRKALYVLLKPAPESRFLRLATPGLDEFRKFQQAFEAIDQKLGTSRAYWFQGRKPETDLVESLRLQSQLLAQAVSAPAFKENLTRILMLRARREIEQDLAESKAQVGEVFKQANAYWTEMKYQPLDTERSLEDLGSLNEKVVEWLRRNLPALLEESLELSKEEQSAEERRNSLYALTEKRLAKEPDLRGEHYILEKNPENAENEIREKLVRSRQRVFEKRTPNPQRKGIALIMIPEGLIWPSGNAATLRRFLESSSSQILAVRSQVEDYPGSRIWIYYEDLFNPPEHIRNIDEYYRTYATQEFKELFHIDRRFLENPTFKEVHSKHTSVVVTCGNPDCRENISSLARTEHICPGCGRMIRTRCGNEGCTANDINLHKEYKSKTCPVCDGFNHAAWWLCTRHGKVPVEVPIDKDRCPLCIESHQDDPIRFPEECISVRPDLIDSRTCPHCEDEAKKNAKHEIFHIRKDLLPFYRNGVNGHDRDEFLLRVAPKYHLPDKCRCPSCRTILIPVHHLERRKSGRRSELICEGRPAK